MRVLVDTNIILDQILRREPFFAAANKFITMCATKEIDGYIAAHSIPNLFYILRKYRTDAERRQLLLTVCRILKVEAIDHNKIIAALNDADFKDFEDDLQVKCAESISADYIVTRNPKDFVTSPIPCISAEELLAKIQ